MSEELMDPSEWLDAAKAVDIGSKNKVTHLCGDASLVVYNNIDSWTAWCWRCHTRGWVAKPQANMQERLARKAKQKELDDAISYQVRPPFPASFDLSAWSGPARLWLYKAGLGPDLIKKLGAYYHERTGRVVLPVKDSDGQTVFWQARNPDYPSGGPKYISASVPRDRFHVLYGRVDLCDAVCITEDILSAFKVGESGAAVGYGVMGTALGQHTIAFLLGCSLPVLLWFDPDAAGEAARLAIAKQLRLVGLRAAHIRSAKDPKCYSLSEIGDLIRGSYTATNHEGSETILSAASDAQPEVS